MNEWEYQKSSAQVDTDSFSIEVEKKVILKAVVVDNTLKLQWADDEWRQWKALTKDLHFIRLQTEANEKLNAAEERAGKGKGRAA